MLKRTEGIVLKTIPFSDADLIVSFLTPDLGLLRAFAKSPLKTKSRFGSSLEPLTHSKIAFWGKENVSLPRLTQSDIIHSFQSIRDTLVRFLKISEIIELTLRFVPEREANTNIYFLLLHTLHNIEEDWDMSFAVLYYKIHFLRIAGYAPKLDTCGRCGKDGHYFYISQGSILCEACAKGSDVPVRITQGAMKLYSYLFTWSIQKIQRIKPTNVPLTELSDIIDMHVRHILVKPLNSETFIRSLSRYL